MNRRTFNQYISESNFCELFITEMGWNNPKGQTDFEIGIDETEFHFRQIAERNGFQVFTCEVRDLPSSSLCKKLDTKLRRSANDYICIFLLPNSQHHQWAVPVKKVEKRDIVLVEYLNAEAAGFLFEKIEGLSFDLDERTTITDVVEKVQAAFIVNSEKLTKDFYSGFKKEHTNFAKFISGIDDHISDKDNRNKQWYTSVMLNRLMFCYFIQKKGFLDGDVDYLRHKLERHQEQSASRSLTKKTPTFFNSFYKGFLVTLFHGGLNAPKHDHDFEDVYGRIPYLNGGMFDVHQIEQDYAELDIADDAFISLFNFFDKWHWHLDDRITASGRDINPDVLGYIFEQYINDRAQMGAYYTKEDITEYIGRNTILPYLMDAALGGHASERVTMSENISTTECVPSLQPPWQFLQQSGDRYIFDAVKKGAGLEIPEEIAIGLDTTKPNLLERRKHWNNRAPEKFALPTEIWRETIERLQRYEGVKAKIENGEIQNINDFITYNLDIRSFVYDLLNTTDDPQLIKRFYAELQKITILDPTCGSGAFLFAALNILEPLYEVCITRMQEFQQQNPELFGVELDEIKHQYRSNIQYFIYKSIILRNLYGVDIMVEATEIAKLRLFLKMVAVVDVDKRDKNLGLDPLPDIDFNIRCGNTLVGYATEKELDEDLDYGDPFAAAELRPLIHEKMAQVSDTYQKFRALQLMQTEEPDAFKRVKGWLKEHLTELNNLLNRKLYQSTTSEETMTFERWLTSHQPFHWLAEFYEIINGNGGFDVIIGNPPYVEYNKKDKETHIAISDLYKLRRYETLPCGDLYAFCVERTVKSLKRDTGNIGMIVPISIVSTDGYRSLRAILTKSIRGCHFSNYGVRPSKLFDGVDKRLTIFISNSTSGCYNTKYYRWNSVEREHLFKNLRYENVKMDTLQMSGFPKISSDVESKIIRKISNKQSLGSSFRKYSNYPVKYTRKLQYFIQFFINAPVIYDENDNIIPPSELKMVFLGDENSQRATISFLNSSLFFWFFITFSDCRNVNAREILNFPAGINTIDNDELNNIVQLSYKMLNNLKMNAIFIQRNDKRAGKIRIQSFQPRLSKPVIDEIDKAIYKHYGFTEEELDFIINYDIKYRMGDELGGEE